MNIDSLNIMMVEIVLCLALAALLGLAVGWLIRRAIAKRHSTKAAQEASKRYKELEESSRVDAKNLEDQIQSLGGELKSLKSNNQNLNDSLRKSEDSIFQARDESIELNQAQLETNERLQTIIRQKDEEIAQLKQSSSHENLNLKTAAAKLGVSSALISQVAPRYDEDMDANETLDATTVLRGPLHSGEHNKQDSQSNDTAPNDNERTVTALDASADQLRTERQSLLNALSDGEATIAIDHADLPIELQQTIGEHDIDATVALSDLDKTINLDDDTEMSDTLETPKDV